MNGDLDPYDGRKPGITIEFIPLAMIVLGMLLVIVGTIMLLRM